MFSKIWRDPVWSTVIGGVVLAIVLAAWATAAKAWPRVGAALVSLWSWLGRTTPVVHWGLVLLGLAAVVVIAEVGLVLWAVFAEKPAAQSPAWRSYTSDRFESLKWTWQYGSGGAILNLVSFCPVCDYQVYPRERYGLNGSETIFACEDCGYVTRPVAGDPRDQQDRIERKIQKNLRNESWPRQGEA